MDNKELEKNARLIIDYSRKQLAIKFPPLAAAIYFLTPEPVGEDYAKGGTQAQAARRPISSALASNGVDLLFDPQRVVEEYVANKNSIAVHILHIVLHGLMQHFGKRNGQDEALFDALTDMKTAALMNTLGFGNPCKGVSRQDVDFMYSASDVSLEAAYMQVRTVSELERTVKAGSAFRMDDHSAWSRPVINAGAEGPGGAKKQWETIALQTAAQMAQSGKQWGDMAGEFSEVYRETEDSTISYSDLLKRFLLPQEVQAVDPDSINRIWYHVGLDQFGDIPFIEPDELREDAYKIELAVAIDTSGSCCGEVLQRFLGELLAVVRDSGSAPFSMTLIQCDTEVQNVRHLETEDQVQDLVSNFRMYGGGGTDFRPVFDYLEKQKEEPDGTPFRGLLYLSDGCGEFPGKAPDYPVIFVIPEDEYYCDEFVPDWVTKAIITETGLKIEEAA